MKQKTIKDLVNEFYDELDQIILSISMKKRAINFVMKQSVVI